MERKQKCEMPLSLLIKANEKGSMELDSTRKNTILLNRIEIISCNFIIVS